MEAHLPIHNTDRAAGTILGSELTLRYGEDGLPEGSIQVRFEGSAGQSFGAFLPKGISFTLLGSFPEKAKLDEIAKFAGFRIVPMIFDEYGCLVPAPAEEKHPTSRRRF